MLLTGVRLSHSGQYRRYWNTVGVHHLTFADEIIEAYPAADDKPNLITK